MLNNFEHISTRTADTGPERPVASAVGHHQLNRGFTKAFKAFVYTLILELAYEILLHIKYRIFIVL